MGVYLVSTLGMILKKSMRGCLTHEKIDKLIIDNSMLKYALDQLSGVTQVAAKSVNTMVAV